MSQDTGADGPSLSQHSGLWVFVKRQGVTMRIEVQRDFLAPLETTNSAGIGRRSGAEVGAEDGRGDGEKGVAVEVFGFV